MKALVNSFWTLIEDIDNSSVSERCAKLLVILFLSGLVVAALVAIPKVMGAMLAVFAVLLGIAEYGIPYLMRKNPRRNLPPRCEWPSCNSILVVPHHTLDTGMVVCRDCRDNYMKVDQDKKTGFRTDNSRL